MEALRRRLSRAVRDSATGISWLLFDDPGWPDSWRAEIEQRVQSGIASIDARLTGGECALLIATSGSSGLPKLCVHTVSTLRTAAVGFHQRFPQITHAVSLLPHYHIGGIMPGIRAEVAGGQCHHADYRRPETISAAPFPLEQAAVSMVPTQLARLMDQPDATSMLQRCGLILIGGAACPPSLRTSARAAQLPVCLCYGMTETAAMVTALDPVEFLNGANHVGPALPHARLSSLPDGRLAIESDANLLGQFPSGAGFQRQPFVTSDIGRVDADGNWSILGRADRVLISGGVNVQPESVERAALEYAGVTAVRCLGIPDSEWGTRIKLLVAANHPLNLDELRAHLRATLPPAARPKELEQVEEARISFKGVIRDG